MTTRIRIGTRGSALAMRQTDDAVALLRTAVPDLAPEIVVITTSGDSTPGPLPVKDKAYFTKEIDAALFERRIDLAVHSLKDMLTFLPEGIQLTAVLPRLSPYDALVPKDPAVLGLQGLPKGANVGTSSIRRMCELLRVRPDLKIEPMRGNLDTRLRKLDEGTVDALVVAEAGLRRLGFAGSRYRPIPPEDICPPAGQGGLGLVTRTDDPLTAVVEKVDDPLAHATAEAERTFLRALHGGCQIPAGIIATVREDGQLRLYAFISSHDGKRSVRGEITGPLDQGRSLAERLAIDIFTSGGEELVILARNRDMAGQLRPPEAP